jgi:hypothetical protein
MSERDEATDIEALFLAGEFLQSDTIVIGLSPEEKLLNSCF